MEAFSCICTTEFDCHNPVQSAEYIMPGSALHCWLVSEEVPTVLRNDSDQDWPVALLLSPHISHGLWLMGPALHSQALIRRYSEANYNNNDVYFETQTKTP